jgi:hypothetical protein
MDIATSDAVKDELLKTNPTFRDLIHQHQNYEQRLSEEKEINGERCHLRDDARLRAIALEIRNVL